MDEWRGVRLLFDVSPKWLVACRKCEPTQICPAFFATRVAIYLLSRFTHTMKHGPSIFGLTNMACLAERL